MNYIDEVAVRICRLAEEREPIKQELLLYRMYAVLALSGYVAITNAAIHDCWAVYTLMTNANHRSIVPYEQLTVEVRELDSKYRIATEIVCDEIEFERQRKDSLKALAEAKAYNDSYGT